jgi:hypothetical protein
MELFAVCTKQILHHGKIAFHKGHVYVTKELTIKGIKIYNMVSDQDSSESFPKEYFEENFKIIK